MLRSTSTSCQLAGLIFAQLAQLAQLPIVASGLSPAELDNALLCQRVQRVSAEHGGADSAIQAVQDVVPVAVGDELRDGARAHTAPVGVPTVVPAVDGDLALHGLVILVLFDRTVVPLKVLEEHGDRVERRGAGDH